MTSSPARPSLDRLPCRQHDPDLWFADLPADIELAKMLCTSCPLRAECLAGALERREPAGVWGGELFDHGSILSHKRARGRPRKGSTPPVRYPTRPSRGNPATSRHPTLTPRTHRSTSTNGSRSRASWGQAPSSSRAE